MSFLSDKSCPLRLSSSQSQPTKDSQIGEKICPRVPTFRPSFEKYPTPYSFVCKLEELGLTYLGGVKVNSRFDEILFVSTNFLDFLELLGHTPSRLDER